MSEHMLGIMIPVWIGIVFNLVMSLFNVIGISLGLSGPFVDWYLGGDSVWQSGGLKIMAAGWVLLIGWSIYNAFNY